MAPRRSNRNRSCNRSSSQRTNVALPGAASPSATSATAASTTVASPDVAAPDTAAPDTADDPPTDADTPSADAGPQYQCPFSLPRAGVKTLCRKPPSNSRRTVKKHLRSIRMRRADEAVGDELSPIGFDYEHRADDPLWQSPEVQSLLCHKPPPKSEEQRRLAKKARNDRFYGKRMTLFRQVEQEWGPKVQAGIITKQSYLEKLREVGPIGFYKAKTEAEYHQVLEDTSMAENARLENLCDSFLDQIWPVHLNDEAGNPLQEPQRDSSGNIVTDSEGNVRLLDIFDGRAEEPETRITSIFPLPNWSRPTFEHYCQIIALILPADQWPKDPLNKKAHGLVVKMLTSDGRQYQKHNLLGAYLDTAERTSVLQTFNTAHTDAVSAAKNLAVKEDQKAVWIKVQDEIKRVFVPASNPPIVFLKMLEQFANERASRRRAREEAEQAEQASNEAEQDGVDTE